MNRSAHSLSSAGPSEAAGLPGESPGSPASTESPAAPLLSVRGLTVEYGAPRLRTGAAAATAAASTAGPATAAVDLEVHRGEVVAVVGESGSGKSTLARAIIGLLPDTGRITAGSITFDGQDLGSLPDRGFRRLRGRRIGLVPQDPGASLDPVKTIGSQVAEIYRLHPDAGRRGKRLTRAELHGEVIRLLELVGIDRPEERMHQYPHELSGGLKQRVLIAIAFALQPDLLIADEPTSALDVTVQSRVLEVFDRLARSYGTAVLFVTHDLAVATDYASRVVVMNGGRIREDRPVLDILTRPQDPYTAQLLASAAPGHQGNDAGTRPPSSAPAVRVPGVPAVAPSSSAPAALEVRNLTKVFARSGAERRAVDDVSFTVRAGTTFALVGESGSGKSTTARLILRLLNPTGGTIRVAGEDATATAGSARRELWRSLQLVYQNPDTALDPRLSVADIIGEPLRNYRIGSSAEQQARVAELLEQVKLPGRLARSRPMELSGGQRQRVAIARALAPGAGTLVLDEALSALDVLTQTQVLELLKSLQDQLGLSYLFISHDLHVVERISDDVGVMHRGQLVETGPTADVFGSPVSEYTRRLLAANPGRRLRDLAAAREPAPSPVWALPVLSSSGPEQLPVPALLPSSLPKGTS
ncbi:ABC transporter ATP-binding protein [Arthrobacter sp. ATA002]|uniref:ABC transporter ATP-binding protein n=1 Tax=Arthrobacter sp. ATA002 TaxID=2991715 RepID=UPI0022A6AF27|nr:ABC transporter ATP-binding protein [Arthrobacter sp. ATA002]WAP51423.1 ABC transporter ATP-binding protein [Arthrobacter sp. ATA002]